MDENPMAVVLQVSIIFLCLVILIMLYLERANTSNISQKVNEFKCPECPKCPDCPACNCNDEGCPDCNCPENTSCPECPKCPDVNTSCPSQSNITAEEIVDAIFPGRNKGFTSYGQYFPLDGLGEASVEPAYSPVINMMPNYVGGDGVPAAISFSDQTLLNNNSSIGLASRKQPPITSGQGVMSQSDNSTMSTTTPTTVSQTVSDSSPSPDNSQLNPPATPQNSTNQSPSLLDTITGGIL